MGSALLASELYSGTGGSLVTTTSPTARRNVSAASTGDDIWAPFTVSKRSPGANVAAAIDPSRTLAMTAFPERAASEYGGQNDTPMRSSTVA